jgi:type IV pilus assembly protein PilV
MTSRRDGVIRSRPGTARRQLGVSLIEVLVSIVIAAIGLLALAGVNATSVKYTKLSQYRGTATLLATDIGERMRANKAGAVSYAFTTTNFAAQVATPAAPAKLCHTVGVICVAAELAAYDLYTWRLLVRSQLPSGSIYIDYQGAQLAQDVWVVWRDPAVSNDDEHSTAVNECPANLTVGADKSVRCSYFRVNL